MKEVSRAAIKSYLIIILINGILGLFDVSLQISGIDLNWLSIFIGLFAFLVFIFTFFVLALFKFFSVDKKHYILPIYYIVSYVIISFFAGFATFTGMNVNLVNLHFIIIGLITGCFEFVFSIVQLKRLPKKNV